MQSVLRQDYPDMEYLVIDGGSTDGSAEIIRDLSDQLTHWVSEEDRGQSDALAKGFAAASGDVLAWLNADDLLYPHALRRVGRAFARRPGVDIVVGEVLYIDTQGQAGGYTSPPFPGFWDWRHELMRLVQPATFFRREAYERVGGVRLDLHFMMDGDLWRKIMMSGGRAHVLHEPLAFFRINKAGKQGDPDGFREEQERVHREWGISKAARALAYYKMQALRIADGSHLRSRIKALAYRGLTAAEIWAQADRARSEAPTRGDRGT